MSLLVRKGYCLLLFVLFFCFESSANQCQEIYSAHYFFIPGRLVTVSAQEIYGDAAFGLEGFFKARIRRESEGKTFEVDAFFAEKKLEDQFMRLRYPRSQETLKTHVSGRLEFWDDQLVLMFDRIWQRPETEFETSSPTLLPFTRGE